MKVLRIISRLILGIIFIFSGYVKAIDPLGSAYKFGDYFISFHIEFLNHIALPLAILLSSFEFLIGFGLLLGVRMKLFSRLVTLFMVFFLILTLYIAIKNPVSDCGCFGDAIILSNWDTFKKNLILMIFVTLVYLSRNKFHVLLNPKTEWAIIFVGLTFIVGLSVYCLRHLPIMDFRPYNVGTYIPEKMIIPDDAPADEYITYLYYEKEGETKEFTDQEKYPWDDSTWTFIESRSELVKKGYIPPIHDFNITSPEGEDITNLILEDENYSFLLVSYDLGKANKTAFSKFNNLRNKLIDHSCAFYCLTSSTEEEINALKKEIQTDYGFYTADEITLKTIIRSNPGLVLIKDGIIIGKWHYIDWPDFSSDIHLLSSQIITLKKDNEKARLYIILLYFILLISIFKFVRTHFYPKNK